MIKAVLIDIDNTLILFDEEDFFRRYLGRLAPAFSDLMSREEFLTRLIGASRTLLRNRGARTNADHYMEDFTRGMDGNRGEIWNRFTRFYEDGFEALRACVTPIEGVRGVIDELRRDGLKLVAASHPLWPERVQQIRLGWAGLDPLDFHHITHIENTAFCKPQPGYYQEICDVLRVPPGECLMVGNDLINDMAAAAIGMKTYLTTDAEENGFVSFEMSRKFRENPSETIPEPDFRGSLRAVPETVRRLVT